jgi:GWxTD domain-containing protein
MSGRASIWSTWEFVTNRYHHGSGSAGRLRPPRFFHMRVATFVAFILTATSATAQMSGRYSDWPNGPVRHLLTREEIKQWKAIQSDADAEAFIDLFWAKRDPTPNTAFNEFREAFENRVAFADEQFSNGRDRGSLTDRGKVLILLGPPYNVTGSGGGHNYRVRARQMWTYAHDKKPQYVPQSDFMLVFEDQGINDWELAHTERANPDIILQEAVAGLIVSPKLTKAPFRADASLPHAHSTTFKDLLLETAYKQFRSGEKTTIGASNLTWAEFVTPAGEHFISAQLYVPAGGGIVAGQKVNFFSIMENAAGEIVDVDETPATMTASGADAYVDKSLPLRPGSYTATFGLTANEHVLTATRVPMTVENLDPAAPAISPLFLSNDVYVTKTAYAPMDPFTFGTLKVIPKGDSIFTPKGDLWYFVELRNPGVTVDGQPRIRVKIDIDGTTPKGPAQMKFPLEDTKATKLTNNRYALGLAIPLEGFIPGEYTIKVHVVDTVLGKNYDLEKHFRVRPLS